MARVVVDVMPKPEILDPQGKAVTGALARLGFAGVSVRQGKRFELDLEGELTEERLAEVHRVAEILLANPVIETFNVRVEGAEAVPSESPVEAPDAIDTRAAETERAAPDRHLQAPDAIAANPQAKSPDPAAGRAR